MQATSGVVETVEKEHSYSQAIEDLLRWPIRWWSSCETRHEDEEHYGYHSGLLGEGVSSRQTPGRFVSLPGGPKDRSIARFIANREEMSLGEPLYGGQVLYVNGQSEVREVMLSVHMSGFSITAMPCLFAGEIANDLGLEVQTLASFSFSPFSIVSHAQLASPNGPASAWAPFKLTVVRAEGDRQYLFVASGKNAVADRDKWVLVLSSAIMQVTCSLFPPYSMEVRPLPAVPGTSTRIMAGYLLRCETSDCVALLYGELHAYFDGEARLALYKDEWCDQKVSVLQLSAQMDVHSCKGVDCSIFALDGHLYAARTQEERLVWLRALGNIKVKLLYTAPDPSPEEVAGFRAAIFERILDLKQAEASKRKKQPLLPLLPARPRMAPKSLLGDDKSPPEPLDDEHGTTQSMTRSRMSEHPVVSEEEIGACRLALVVDLMDMSECREFLKPFDASKEDTDTTVNLDLLRSPVGDDTCTAVDLDSLRSPLSDLSIAPFASPDDMVSVIATEQGIRRASPVDSSPIGERKQDLRHRHGPSGAERTQDLRCGPHGPLAPSPQLLGPHVGDRSLSSRTVPPSSPEDFTRLLTSCMPDRADMCRRRCAREGPASTVQSYPDLLTLPEKSRDREASFVFV